MDDIDNLLEDTMNLSNEIGYTKMKMDVLDNMEKRIKNFENRLEELKEIRDIESHLLKEELETV